MTDRKIPRVSQRQLRAKKVRMGALVVLSYAEPGYPSTDYEGILTDKRVGATDRESYVELKKCKRLGSGNSVAEIIGNKRFTDSYIENIVAAEPREETPAASAPAPDAMAGMPGAMPMPTGMMEAPNGAIQMQSGGGQMVMTPQGPMMMMPQGGGGMGGGCGGGMMGMQGGMMPQGGGGMMGQMMMTPNGPVMMMPQGSVPQGAQIVMTPQGPMMMVPSDAVGGDGDDDDDDDEGDGEDKADGQGGIDGTGIAPEQMMPFPQATQTMATGGEKFTMALPGRPEMAGGMGGMWFPQPQPAGNSSKEAVASIANKMAEAAKAAATKAMEAKSVAASAPPPPPPLGGLGRGDGGSGLRFSNDPDGMKAYDPEGGSVPTLSSTLGKGRYLPSPTREQPTGRQQQQRKRSRSRRREPVERRPSPKVTRRRRGGWDDATPGMDATSTASVMAHQAAITTPPPSSYNPLPAAVGTGVRPLFAGIKPGPGGHLGPRTGTPEVMHQAVMRAQEVEAAGRAEYHRTGKLPRGPPDLPIGTAIIEQRYVAYIIGGGGQALAAINQAAGVSCQVDQSTKMYGYSMVNIYGPEEGAERAKLIIAQKIKDYRPKHMQ